MAVAEALIPLIAVIAAAVAFTFTAAQESQAPAPAPSSDGTSIDQGVAYILMLIALVLTYVIHSTDMDFTSYKLFSI